MISCLMATRNRPSFLLMAIAHFLYQAHLDSELIIVDDSPTSNILAIESSAKCPRIHYIHLDHPASQGEKLNIAADLSSGEVLAKLDDDDYYAPLFLSTLNHEVLNHPTNHVSLWCCAYISILYRNPDLLHFTGHGFQFGSTMGFHRAFWNLCPFPLINQNTDSQFISRSSANVNPICGHPELHIVMRHGANTWNRICGMPVDDFFGRKEPSELKLVDIAGKANMEFYSQYARYQV